MVWAKKKIPDDLNDQVRRCFDANAVAALSTAERHEFFTSLEPFVEAVDKDYQNKVGAGLLVPGTSLELGKKSFDSTVDKLFRKNVLLNKRFPAAPKNGWFSSQNCASRINDIVRGILVCRYLDGPEFLAQRLKARAEEMKLPARYYSQQNDRGYYAFHFYVSIPVEIVDLTWRPSTVEVQIEIQLSTQLQEVLRSLTHKSYEHLRLLTPTPDDGWKWDFGTERFKASYLGHTLHLIEGLIVELLRDANKKPENKS